MLRCRARARRGTLLRLAAPLRALHAAAGTTRRIPLHPGASLARLQDQGINVSNRAKELGALMASPDRIRCGEGEGWWVDSPGCLPPSLR